MLGNITFAFTREIFIMFNTRNQSSISSSMYHFLHEIKTALYSQFDNAKFRKQYIYRIW